MRRILPLLSGVVLFSSLASAQIVPDVVDTCGQTVQHGILEADLDCRTMTSGFAVTIQAGGSLDLAGHALISGDAPDGVAGGGIFCQAECTVIGGGGRISSGVLADARSRPRGISSPPAVGDLPRPGKATVSGLAILYYDQGIDVRVVRARRVTVQGTRGSAVSGQRVNVARSTLIENGQGIAAFRAVIRRSDIMNNGNGGLVRHGIIRRSTITGHQIWGINASDGAEEGTLAIFDSTIDENCLVQDYGDDCWDFATSSEEAPEVEDVECTRSGRYDISSETWSDWDICSDD